jgi:succinate dehydrogenase / fumarate reductase flavoprotein subunit
MYGYIPPKFAAETADTGEEADRWLAGDKNARRPPELLTRDVVARAIRAEVKAGRGSEHGGVYLDISKRRSAEDIRKKLPSMYHQFKELAELDITTEPMEVGPTLHYFMGGVRVDDDTQMSKVPGLFAAGECAGGMHGANRLGGNSLSDLLVFGALAGEGAAAYVASVRQAPRIDDAKVVQAVRRATDVLNREQGPNPYLVQEDLQNTMESYCGIVRIKEDLEQGLKELERIKGDVLKVKAPGASQYNPGWSTALDLRNLVITAEAVNRAALLREESRGAHTRIDFEDEREEWVKVNVVSSRGAGGAMETRAIERRAAPAELAKIAYATLEELEGKGAAAAAGAS